MTMNKQCEQCAISFTVDDTKNGMKRRFCCKRCAAIYVQNKPGVKESKIKFQKEYQNRPDIKEIVSLFQKEYKNRPEVKERISITQLALWNDISYKEKMIAADKAYQSTADARAKNAERQKIAQNRPDVKKQKSEFMKIESVRRWKDPKFAAKVLFNGYKLKNFELPSGEIVKLQGYEPRVLTELLKTYTETDIVIGIKEMINHIGKITYVFNNVEHAYYPDFYIKSTHTIIEVKSLWTYNKDIEKNLVKEQACLQQGFNFEFIIL